MHDESAVLVTGGAGFIGSTLVDRMLALGRRVVAYDNLSTGMIEFLENARASANFKFIEGDLLDSAKLTAAMAGCDIVFHLAANADVRFGLAHPRKDLEQNTVATFNVLEAMRENRIRRIVFSSTGSVYGEAPVIPTPENFPFPVQTSLYGASKLAGEGMISAYCEGFGMQAHIFRFVSIVGERYTHGHIFDFYQQLRRDATSLHILGDGTQRKSYLDVQDCIDAMLAALESSQEKVNIFNLGTDEFIEVNASVACITRHLQLSPTLTYSGGPRGWIGDNPFIYLDTRKIRSLGWTPRFPIRDGIVRTLDWLRANTWVYDRRA